MKIARIGEVGFERPAVIVEGQAYFVDSLISDWNRDSLEAGGYQTVMSANILQLPSIKLSDERLGSPIARPTKLICVGLNYIKHIEETHAKRLKEPIIFMKAPDTLIGPNDDIVIPPHSQSTDYEVELAVIIGKRALYLDENEEISQYILGYSVSQDVSERDWQLNRSGQWVKGKSFPTFNPLGPWIVTPDEVDPNNLRLWCSVDNEMRQDSRTSDLLFGVNHLVWYISQFMEFFPGDVINTGTPSGVGMGSTPTKYLTSGQLVKSGIEGIGEIASITR